MKKHYFLILIVLGFYSCQKEISDTAARTTEVDVYVAGYESNDAGISVAKYWKNGHAISLTDGTREAFSYPSITVAGSDVYVAGGEVESFNGGLTNYVAKYWKNGQAVSLTDVTTGTAFAQSIAVVGSDVYVAGDGDVAKYWKNGQPITLSNTHWSVTRGITIVGSDVYTAGDRPGPR